MTERGGPVNHSIPAARSAMPPGPSELITAVNHPLRRRILRTYLDRSLTQASAAELAEAMNERPAKVSYHLNTLVRCAMLRPLSGENGTGHGGAEPLYGWALGEEGKWLRLVIDFWAQSDPSD